MHDELLVLACDGVWDVIKSDDSLSYVTDDVIARVPDANMQYCASALVFQSLDQDSTDNISVIVVNLGGVAKDGRATKKAKRSQHS
jgi:serine/threonine protein phosphatase PrpC